MRVLWTDAALNQLEAIRDYLAHTSADYARMVVERLVNRSEQMAQVSLRGMTEEAQAG